MYIFYAFDGWIIMSVVGLGVTFLIGTLAAHEQRMGGGSYFVPMFFIALVLEVIVVLITLFSLFLTTGMV